MATTRRSTSAKRTARPTRRMTTSRRVRGESPSARTGAMTVREAGRMGGLKGGKKGGEKVKAERGVEFYKKIGRKGGRRVRQLIEEGRAALRRREGRTSR